MREPPAPRLFIARRADLRAGRDIHARYIAGNRSLRLVRAKNGQSSGRLKRQSLDPTCRLSLRMPPLAPDMHSAEPPGVAVTVFPTWLVCVVCGCELSLSLEQVFQGRQLWGRSRRVLSRPSGRSLGTPPLPNGPMPTSTTPQLHAAGPPENSTNRGTLTAQYGKYNARNFLQACGKRASKPSRTPPG